MKSIRLVIDNGVQTLNFLGSGIASITNAGGNQVDITIEGGGGSGTGIFQLFVVLYWARM